MNLPPVETNETVSFIPKLRPLQFAFLLCLCSISGLVGYLIGIPEEDPTTEVRLGMTSKYKYINPLLDYQPSYKVLLMGDINQLKNQLENEIEQAQEDNKIIDASIYYRDLNNGPWFAINDDLTYSPASLLKIPLMIAYYKIAETDQSILDKKITYSTPYTDVPYYDIKHSTSSIEIGNSYTIEELITIMITESDNTATLLLQDNIDIDAAEKVFSDFAVSLPDFLTPKEDYIHAREYASFFRILYNSTYLSREYSEKALALLSQSRFNDGLRAGIDEPLAISHKFGVAIDSTDKKQLHDCGIVYLQNKPYALCIMTTGHNYEKMAGVIADLSRTIYETVKNIDD